MCTCEFLHLLAFLVAMAVEILPQEKLLPYDLFVELVAVFADLF
jgi:hypothetical protein